jgi:hypothetical protein
MRRAAVAVLAGLSIVGTAACGGSGPRQAATSTTAWIPNEPSFGVPVFPSAEFVSQAGRGPGDVTRTWVVVYGGQSYCSTSEEFAINDTDFEQVVAWYDDNLHAAGLPSATDPEVGWEVTKAVDELVIVTAKQGNGKVFVEYDQHAMLSSSDECQSTHTVSP